MLKHPTVTAIVFYVKDLDRTERFYGEVLGLSINRIPGGYDDDGEFLMAKAEGLSLIFFRSEATPGRTPIVVFGLREGIDDIVDGLAASGVEIVLPVSEAPGDGLTADFLDPDGHMLSFYQSAANPRRLAVGTQG
jgi:catechol 2,3-dioxygenase-like lactoylglutathione lyase family enzyme